MVIINSQRSPTLRIVKNIQFKIMNVLISINIHIVNLTKKELLIKLNWFAKYKADLILNEIKLKFQA